MKISLNLAQRLVLLVLLFVGKSMAACTGWGGDNLNLYLNLPTIEIQPQGVPVGTVLAEDTLHLPRLTCDDSSSLVSDSGDWQIGTDSSGDVRYLAPGIFMRVELIRSNGTSDFIPSSGWHNPSSTEFNITGIRAEIVRLNNDVFEHGMTIGNTGAPVFRMTLFSQDIMRFVNVYLSNPIKLTSSCTLGTISDVTLPDIDTTTLKQLGDTGPETSFSLPVTCPSGTEFSSVTLELSEAGGSIDQSDSTLLKNTGSAGGLAIEVINSEGKRISASKGTVSRTSVIGSFSDTWKIRLKRTGVVTSGTVIAQAIVNVDVQ